MRRVTVLILAASLALPLAAQKRNKKSSEMPMPVVAAQFVYITSMRGDIFDPNTTAEDRAAINGIDNAVRAWGKYRVVYRPSEADLMLVVKPAGHGDARVGIGVGPPLDPTTGGRTDSTRPIGPGTVTGADVSSDPNDMLAVSLHPQEPAVGASFIWRGSTRNGLLGNKPALFEDFRKAVEEAARQKP